MCQKGKLLILIIVALFGFTSPLFAIDMAEGLKCPPGWNNNKSKLGNDLIKQCISPSQDAVIELYAASGAEMPLGQLIDVWTNEMNQRGLPFQNFISEVPGQISGYPAVTRTYSGQTSNGVQFDSHIVASRYKDVNYVFQGMCVKGRQQRWEQLRHSMNTWYYPGVSKQNSNNSIGNHASKPAAKGKPRIFGTFIADKKEYIAGSHYYRVYQFKGDSTFTTGLKNVTTGKLNMGTHGTRYRIKKSSGGKGKYVIKGGKSCTDGYITDITENEVIRFKSGCYSSGGKAIYLVKENDSFGSSDFASHSTAKPKISGTFISDKKDYIAGKYYYRVYQFKGNNTFTMGLKSAATGKLKMDTHGTRYRIDKSSSGKGKYVLKGGKSCTDGFITDIAGNDVKRFKSGCYSSGGKAMYLVKVNVP